MSQGIPFAIFLDDGMIDCAQAKLNSLTINADLLKSAFFPKKEKSLWEPIQIILWLGVMHLNTINRSIRAMDEQG